MTERSIRKAPDQATPHTVLQPAGLAAAEGICQWHCRPRRRDRVRRRHDRAGQPGPLRPGLRRADEARAGEHCGGAGGSRRRTAAHRTADLVRRRHGRISRRAARARRRLPRGHGPAFSGHGGGRGQPAGRAARAARDRGHRGAAGTCDYATVGTSRFRRSKRPGTRNHRLSAAGSQVAIAGNRKISASTARLITT